MKKIQFMLSAVFILYGFASIISCNSSNSATSRLSLTKNNIKQTISNPAQTQATLTTGTYTGCVSVPATSWVQRTMVGFEFTGKTCSITVLSNNIVKLSFLGDRQITVTSTSTASVRTDLFVGELESNEVLLVQHHQGKVVSVTHTSYDKNNNLIYGRSGEGDMIKECMILDKKCSK